MAARFFLALILFVAASANAATSAQTVSSMRVSVAYTETKAFSVRFYDSLGQPSVGETVQFGNDACGTFSNGFYAMNVVTDVTGLASAAFTATTSGITCWVTASAGAYVRFDVFTYSAGNVQLSATLVPAEPRPGQPFTIFAAAKSGLYPIYDAAISARVVPGTASATLSGTSGNSGQSGTVPFNVFPDGRVGDYEVELQYRTRTLRVAMRAPANQWQDLWWSGVAENGWGMSVVQHKDMIFGIIYAYDDAGKPIWYVMPGGSWNAAHTAFTGAVYIPKGSPYFAYDARRFNVGAIVGTATLTFNQSDSGALDYTINGISGHKDITRLDFGRVEAATLTGLGDLWWGGVQQDGWGIAVMQQSNTLFSNWYTYDANGAPTWFVMPGGNWIDASTYEGTLYRTTGSPWLGKAYDASKLDTVPAGWFRFKFAGEAATMDYMIDGRTGSVPLVRLAF
jgi:hypothetical protein